MDKLVSLQVERETSEDKKKYMYIHETILHISKGILGKTILPSLSIIDRTKREKEKIIVNNFEKLAPYGKRGSLKTANVIAETV